jgi:hypothetical protein
VSGDDKLFINNDKNKLITNLKNANITIDEESVRNSVSI